MINAVIDLPEHVKPTDLYRAAQSSWIGEEVGRWGNLKPYGELKQLHEAMQEFISAKTPEEVQGAATRLNTLAEKHFDNYDNTDSISRSITWPEFRIPKLNDQLSGYFDDL